MKRKTTTWRILNFHIARDLNKHNNALVPNYDAPFVVFRLLQNLFNNYMQLQCSVISTFKIKSQTRPTSANFHIEFSCSFSIGTTGHIVVLLFFTLFWFCFPFGFCYSVIFSVGVYSIINCCFPKLFPPFSESKKLVGMLCEHKFVQINLYKCECVYVWAPVSMFRIACCPAFQCKLYLLYK